MNIVTHMTNSDAILRYERERERMRGGERGKE